MKSWDVKAGQSAIEMDRKFPNDGAACISRRGEEREIQDNSIGYEDQESRCRKTDREGGTPTKPAYFSFG